MTNANDVFIGFTSDKIYPRQPFGTGSYTDGVKELVYGCQCSWIIDLIFSYQREDWARTNPYQIWKLERQQESFFTLIATDRSNKKLFQHEIPSCNFKYDIATFIFEEVCLMLPCEYDTKETSDAELDLNTQQFAALTRKYRNNEDFPVINCNEHLLQINLRGGTTMRCDIIKAAGRWIRWHADANLEHDPDDNRALGVVSDLIHALSYDDIEIEKGYK